MSNTTPESPEDRPPQESATEPAADTGAHVASTSPADERQPTHPAAEDDLDHEPGDEPGVAGAAPVASSAHISGASETGQTRSYEPATDRTDRTDRTEQADQVQDRPAAQNQTTAYEPPNDYRSTNDYRSPNDYPPPNDYQSNTGQQPAAQPVYVTAPQRPTRKGNRGAGILIALLSTIVYAIVSALVVLVIFMITKRTSDIAMHDFVQYVGTASYYIPIIFFALAFFLLIAIVNRGGWWAYILGAFFVAVIVYFAYVGGVLVTIQAWNFSPGEVGRILSQLWANPLTIGSAIVAREVPIWFGLWIAARGRKVRERNDVAQRDYERAMAEGPQPTDRTA